MQNHLNEYVCKIFDSSNLWRLFGTIYSQKEVEVKYETFINKNL